MWVRGCRLARLVAERSSVIVLDGIEPLQYEPGTDLAGQLKDTGLRGFLGELTRSSGKAFALVMPRAVAPATTHRRSPSPIPTHTTCPAVSSQI